MNYNPNDPYNPYNQYNQYNQSNSQKKSSFKKVILVLVIVASLSVYAIAFFAFFMFVKPMLQQKVEKNTMVEEDYFAHDESQDSDDDAAPEDTDETPAEPEQITVDDNAAEDNEEPAEQENKDVAQNYDINFDEIWDKDDSEKVIYNEENTPTYVWAAHATAIYAKLEYGYPDKITGHIITDSDIPDWEAFLSNAWNIYDRDSAKATIERMAVHGHKESFQEYVNSDSDVEKAIEAISSDFGSDITLEETDLVSGEYLISKGILTLTPYKVKGAALAYLRFGDSGLDGYDYLRLIRVTYISFKCGYISQNEYMKLVELFNDRLRSTYNSFREIHETYYYGEMFRVQYGTGDNDEMLHNIRDALDKIENDGLYESIDRDYDLVDTHDDEYYKMVGKADESSNVYESDIELSDNLEDYTFEVNGRVYKLPLSYDEIVDGGFTPDTDGSYLVPAGESYYFKGDYMGNEYSTMDFAVLNNTDHDMKLADIPIILVNGNQFRWNQYKKYPYRIAKGVEIEFSTIDQVEEMFGPLTVPEDSTEDALGTTLYYYEYQFDTGWYRFIVQPNGEIAGIRMCKYAEKSN